jgi:surface protein
MASCAAFEDASSFNADLSKWDVSSVTSLSKSKFFLSCLRCCRIADITSWHGIAAWLPVQRFIEPPNSMRISASGTFQPMKQEGYFSVPSQKTSAPLESQDRMQRLRNHARTAVLEHIPNGVQRAARTMHRPAHPEQLLLRHPAVCHIVASMRKLKATHACHARRDRPMVLEI